MTCSIALAAALLALSAAAVLAAQAERPEVPRHTDPVVQAVQAHVDRLCAAHDARLARVSGRPALEQELNSARARLLELLDLDLDVPRKPPPVRSTGVIRAADYRIEKLVLESAPGVPVSCLVYVPNGGPARKPALLSPHGHSGRDRPVYQNACQRLARAGFIVLTKDGWGKQERRGTGHGAEGGQLALTGGSLMGLELWDNVRCVDYLLSRPDVDPARLGMAGLSGGGTQTLFTMAIEPRLRAASPTCAVTTFQSDLADTTMCVCELGADLLTIGDHGLFLATAFPRPVLVVNGIRDPIFPIAGARAAVRQARSLYAAGGVPDGIELVEYDVPHTWDDAMLDRQIVWFRQRFGLPDGPSPPADGFRDYALLRSYPEGMIPSRSLSLTEVNRRRIRPATRAAEVPDPAADRDRVSRRVTGRWSGPPALPESVERRELGFDAQRLAALSELSWPSALGGRVRASVSVPGGESVSPRPVVVRLERDRLVPQLDRLYWDDQLRTRAVVVDLQYTGRALPPETEGQVGTALLAAGRSLLAERARDLLTALEVLRDQKLLHEGAALTLVGRGFDGVLLLAAAPLLPTSASLVLDGTPITYRVGAEIDFTTPDLLAPPLHWTILPGLARRHDLADLIGLAQPRRVLLLHPRDAAQVPFSRAGLRSLLRPVTRGGNGVVRSLTVEASRRECLEALADVVLRKHGAGG